MTAIIPEVAAEVRFASPATEAEEAVLARLEREAAELPPFDWETTPSSTPEQDARDERQQAYHPY